MSLVSMRDAIVAKLKAEVPALVSVEAHPGDFDLTEIKRHFGHYPRAARVVCSGVRSAEDETGLPVARAKWVIFIAAREQNAADPDGAMSAGDACMLLSQRVVELVHGEDWGAEAHGNAENITARNLYSGSLDKRGLSLWAVEWDQDVAFDGRLVTALDRLATIHTDFELSAVHEGPDSSITTEFPAPEEEP